MLQIKNNTDLNTDVVLPILCLEVKKFRNLFWLDFLIKVRQRERIDINRRLKIFCKSNFVKKIYFLKFGKVLFENSFNEKLFFYLFKLLPTIDLILDIVEKMVSEQASTMAVEKYQISIIGNYFISREVKQIP